MSQLVRVELAPGVVFTYRWNHDSPIYVGDHVLLPGNWRSDWESFWGVVVDIGSDYGGVVLDILERRLR